MPSKIDIDSISRTPDSMLFIGDWKLSKTVSIEVKYKNGNKIETEYTTVCNVCPTVIFKSDNVGIVRDAIGEEVLFNWEICKDKIYFSFSKKSDEDSFFSLDKVFYYKIYYDSENSYIELSEKKHKYKYILIGVLNR
jgi:hypothetical protein